MGSYNPTPNYGRRLLPVVVDETARDEPNKPCFSLPRTDSDLSQGYVDVTYATFANAINQLAWIIELTIGRSNTFETMAYLGTPDIRYHILQMAATKTGYQVLFSSHTNSPTGHLALMDKCNCTILLSASGVAVNDILASRPTRHLLIPELDKLLTAAPAKHCPYTKTFDEAAQDPYLILHSSGTTGLPKPIKYTHGAIAALDAHRSLPDIDEVSGMHRSWGVSHPGPGRYLVPFLQFHGISSFVTMCAVVFSGCTYVVPFRHRAMERSDLINVLKYANVDTAFFSPAMIEDMASNPESPEYLKKLRLVHYGGASLNHAAATYISQYTHLRSQWGITESGKIVDLLTAPEDYDYCAFDLLRNGLEFRPIPMSIPPTTISNTTSTTTNTPATTSKTTSTPTTPQTQQIPHEMILRATPASSPLSPYFTRNPHLQNLPTGDLWSPHHSPSKSRHLWKFVGRTDDLITYQDGVNFHPSAWELRHSEHALIRAACIAGTGHRQPFLLLELFSPNLTKTLEQRKEIVDKLWVESIEKVNREAPTNGRIAKTHIIFASEGKPFERTPKGTVARKATLRGFEREIEACYLEVGDGD